MKRSTKAWLSIAGCMVAAGLLLSVIGQWMGGYHIVKDWVESGELSWNFGFAKWNFGSEDSVKLNDRYPVYEGTVDRTRIEDAGNIERLVLDAGGGLIEIKTSDDGNYYFASDNAKRYQCYAEGTTLELRVKSGSWIGNRSYEHTVTLWVPEDASFQRIDLEIGGGELKTETLSGDEISVAVGGGSIEADKLLGSRIELALGAGEITVRRAEAERIAIDVGAGQVTVETLIAGVLDVEIGAGQAVLGQSTVGNADLSVSAGQIQYKGTINGNLDAECSMGEIVLELTGKKGDHNYEVECSMGEITLGGDSFSGLASSKTIRFDGVSSNFELDCSMGAISVTFEE